MSPFIIFNDILEKYVGDKPLMELPYRWSEKHRHYHTVNHLTQVLADIENDYRFKDLSVNKKHALLLAAFFHDIVYDPKRQDNEEKSIEYFIRSYKGHDPRMIDTVCEIIECTKYRKRPTNKLQRIMWDADNKGFTEGYETLLKNEKLIRKEFIHLSHKEYKEKRITFLNSFKGLFNSSVDKHLDKLIAYIEKTY